MAKVVKTETTIKEFDKDDNVVRTIVNTQQISQPEVDETNIQTGMYL